MKIFAGGSLPLAGGITCAGRHLSVAFCATAVTANNTMPATHSRVLPFEFESSLLIVHRSCENRFLLHRFRAPDCQVDRSARGGAQIEFADAGVPLMMREPRSRCWSGF